MKHSEMMYAVLAMGLFTCHADAALSVNIISNTGDAPAGQVSNDYYAETDVDLLDAGVFITLSTGSLYNPNPLVPGVEIFQQSPGDTYVTMNGNPDLILFGANEIGHVNPIHPGAAEFGPAVLGAIWATTTIDDIGTLFLGTLSFSADANGSGQLLLINKNQSDTPGGLFENEFVLLDVTVTNGVLTPEPTALGLLSLGGLTLLRRKK